MGNSMDVQIVDGDANVDPTMGALRVRLCPTEYDFEGSPTGGHFGLAASFLSTAALLTAGAHIFAIRWVDGSKYFILKRLAITTGLSTAFTNAQVCDYDLIKLQKVTTPYTNGTSINLGSADQKMRTNDMSGSLLGADSSLLISSGGPLENPLLTTDVQPFGYVISLVQPAAAANATGVQSSFPVPLFELARSGQHPCVIAAGEGLAVRVVTAHGAAGVVRHGLIMEWVEAAQY